MNAPRSNTNRKKFIKDFKILENIKLSEIYSHLVLSEVNPDDFDFQQMCAGQFVEIQILRDTVALRRPISVHFIDVGNRQLHLLVRVAGTQTSILCSKKPGETLNLVLPLGNGFSLNKSGPNPLLVGGGIGVAPLLYLGKQLNDKNIKPTFLLAAKTASDLLMLERFSKYGDVIISTDDGSMGHAGLVTLNPALTGINATNSTKVNYAKTHWSHIYCCGSMPMMKGVAKIARQRGLSCEVSLENSMACGLGACLCCVEDTKDSGNVCVCTDGPVFDAERLKWFD